ncbi:hypothetical protein TrLO_g10748 [Triparma laevis f. longispina]|nr:hypothetical protein TrLO_g10748 [Triparma laevis f. longispina]
MEDTGEPQEDTALGNIALGNSAFGNTNALNNTSTLSKSYKISSIGKILSKRSSISQMRSMKIVPMQDSRSTALSCLRTPDANAFTKDYNADVEFENEKVL